MHFNAHAYREKEPLENVCHTCTKIIPQEMASMTMTAATAEGSFRRGTTTDEKNGNDETERRERESPIAPSRPMMERAARFIIGAARFRIRQGRKILPPFAALMLSRQRLISLLVNFFFLPLEERERRCNKCERLHAATIMQRCHSHNNLTRIAVPQSHTSHVVSFSKALLVTSAEHRLYNLFDGGV